MTDPVAASPPVTVTATFCATLVDEWVRHGVAHAMVAPGSRSTPLALALAARGDLRVHVFHDERSAAFAALGIGRATGMPAVLLCTSGTAAANFHPAVIEAHQGNVPLVVGTADRPPELRDVAAPQTIDQVGLYGSAVRWFCDPGVPDDAVRDTWRSLAARAVLDARGPRPGPVQLNLPFRDPLVGTPGELPPARVDGWHRALVGDRVLDDDALAALAAVLDQQRGAIVAGAGAGDPSAIHAFAESVGWPVLADPRSGCRRPGRATVAAFDAILRHAAFARDHAPAVVLRLGFPPASKVLNQWITASGAVQVQVHASAQWIDPDRLVATRVVADPSVLCAALTGRVRGATGTTWAARWRHAEQRAQAALDAAVSSPAHLTEPAVSRTLTAALPDGAALVVSSSMPVRDVEWYGVVRDGLTVHANRGANGIDGVVSTAVGVALASPATPTALLIGDLAFLHDTSGLLALRGRDLNLTIVVVDNRGGAIFSFLPQKAMLPADRYEQLFGTPADTDPAAVAAAHGLDVQEVATVADLRAAVAHATERQGVRVLVVRSDRDRNVADHDALHRAVAAAL